MNKIKTITVVAADLGGTNIRFRLGNMTVKNKKFTLGPKAKRYKTKDFIHQDYNPKTRSPKIDGMRIAFENYFKEMGIK